ncbi:uncharacterized protein LOC100889000 isoform X3 [Strongylocentrotus purpuratus]|uniref:Ubiquitinyl hydrolase 1 n=1 Tax=Strongylocentrotus purpuratus TaxID=7668 RepID=A0A7M7NRR0_STRPU|nr:uncharacterized protein LOC100889000 isoform X3 [Strongylocentrotus purpuratus]
MADNQFVEECTNIARFLADGTYPELGMSVNKKRGLRKKAATFKLSSIDGLTELVYTGRGCEERRVIPRKEEQKKILAELHVNSGGHLGRDRTRHVVLQRFYWPGISHDVAQYIKCCVPCQKAAPSIKHKQPLHPIPVTGVWDQIGVDLIGPLKETGRGHKYIVTLTDYFSKWAEAAPIPNKEAKTIAQFLHQVMLRFGFVDRLITDQGREFNNELVTSLLKFSGTRHCVSSAYHPQTNGLVERFNQTLICALQKVTNEECNDWDEKIDAILFAYRTSPQGSTRYSPFQLMFNREPRLPIDVVTSSSTISAPSPEEVEQVFVKVQAMSDKIRDHTKINVKAAQQKQKRHYDERHHVSKVFSEGSWVLKKNMRRDTRQGDKLTHRTTGPFIIEKYVSKGVYILRNPLTDTLLKQKVNGSHLIPFNRDSGLSTDTSTNKDGIRNTGNTCYMNATAQILVASPVVHLYREQSVHKIPALDGVLQLYNADNTAAVKKAVQSLKDLLPSYNDAEQHDAGRFMLDILSSQCLHCGSSKCTFLQSCCHLQGHNELKCPNCDASRLGGELDYGSMPVECRSNKSLDTTLEEFFSWATVDFKGLCDKCGQTLTKMEKRPVAESPPDFLWVTLQRWKESEVRQALSESRLTKNTERMNVSHCLSLPLKDGFMQEYHLGSLMMHEGSSMSSGHYTALVCKETWILYDDEKVSVTDIDLASPSIAGVGYKKGHMYKVEKASSQEAVNAAADLKMAAVPFADVLNHVEAIVAGKVRSSRHDLFIERKLVVLKQLSYDGLGEFSNEMERSMMHWTRLDLQELD